MLRPCIFFFSFLPKEIIKGCECSLGDTLGNIPSVLICCILIVHAFATVYNYSLFWFDDCRLKSNWNSSLSHPTSFSVLNLPSLTFWFFFQQTMSSQCLPRIQNSFLRCFVLFCFVFSPAQVLTFPYNLEALSLGISSYHFIAKRHHRGECETHYGLEVCISHKLERLYLKGSVGIISMVLARDKPGLYSRKSPVMASHQVLINPSHSSQLKCSFQNRSYFQL